MMKTATLPRAAAALVLALLLAACSAAAAFIVPHPSVALETRELPPAPPRSAFPPVHSVRGPPVIGRFNVVSLDAKKGKLTDEEKPLQEMPSATELLFAFMNPLRNPNSIFIYMLILLQVLGTIKENQ